MASIGGKARHLPVAMTMMLVMMLVAMTSMMKTNLDGAGILMMFINYVLSVRV